MALNGSLDDFNIVNILQMIKLEGKTGRLSIVDKEEKIKITFDSGNIVYAESNPAKDEARISNTLLRNALIDSAAWDEIKKQHENTLRPYWELLAQKIPANILIELIGRQTIGSVYCALRFKSGSYKFSQMRSIRYNNKVMKPMDIDPLLIEGCRLADEWPRLLKSVPPPATFIVKNIIGDEEPDKSITPKEKEGSAGGDWDTALEREILKARGFDITRSQIALLTVIGAGLTIEEAIDGARQGEFETLSAVSSLLATGIIKPVQKQKKSITMDKTEKATGWYYSALAITVVLCAGFYMQFTFLAGTLEAQKDARKTIQAMKAENGIRKIEHSLKIYKALQGSLPKSLDALAKEGYLPYADLIDPWNNPYRLAIKKDKFALFSTGPDNFMISDDIYLL